MLNQAQNRYLASRGYTEATFNDAPPEIRLEVSNLATVADPAAPVVFNEAQMHFLRGRNPADLDEGQHQHLEFWGDPIFAGKLPTTPAEEHTPESLARAPQPAIDRVALQAAHPERRLAFARAQETLARAAAEAKSPVKSVRAYDIEAAEREVAFFTKQPEAA